MVGPQFMPHSSTKAAQEKAAQREHARVGISADRGNRHRIAANLEPCRAPGRRGDRPNASRTDLRCPSSAWSQSSQPSHSAIMASVGMITPMPNMAGCCSISIRPDFPTSARCPSSISMPMAAASTCCPRSLAKVLPFDLFETRRLVGAIVGLIGIFITWRLARRVGGPLAALIAVALLATCPLYYGNMFMNAKDSPFAVAMVFLTLALVRAFEEYPRPSPITCAMVGIAAGLAIGTRVLGGLAAINALAALGLVFAVETRRDGLRRSGRGSRHFRRPLRAGTPARLCRDGAGVAVVGHRAAQPVAGGGVLLPFLRKAVEGDVRRNGGAGAGDAAPIRAAALPAQGARNLSRPGSCRNRRRAGGGDAPRHRDIAARDLSAARLCRRIPDRARGADQARHVQRHPPFRVRGATRSRCWAGSPAPGSGKRCCGGRGERPGWRSRCSCSACSCRSRRW